MDDMPSLFSGVLKSTFQQKPLRVLGIDLGTTNSVAAEIIFDPKHPERIEACCLNIEQLTLDGRYIHLLVPSVVAVHEERVWVGEGAKRMIAKAVMLNLKQNRDLFYECKNDMGIKRTYFRAPEGFQSAPEIGGHVLEFIINQALAEDPTPIDRTVVTVPASFQLAQRTDTIAAAELAGLRVSGGDLLDEPIAAFIDYMISHEERFPFAPGECRNILVFDFGGGTCDVAVFKLARPKNNQSLEIAILAVSRYYRLGGGDLDRAILYDILIPRLIEENGLGWFDLGYADKHKYIEPALLAAAEGLKIKICKEIERLQGFGKYDNIDKDTVVTSLPGSYDCPIRDTVFTLQSPSISATQFEETLKPFLDRDLLYPKDDEYKLVCSIFAPLEDAISCSGLDAGEIDYCLLMGGSSLIPQVREAVAGYFSGAEILNYADDDMAQTAMAKGAAYHALSLALQGRGFIEPVCHETISLRCKSGLLELVPKGTILPYPSDKSYYESEALMVPETIGAGSLLLKLEIVAGDFQRVLASDSWEILGPVEKGEPLLLQYKYDENQVLELNLTLSLSPERQTVYHLSLEKPLSNVVNPDSIRERIYEREENLRRGRVAQACKLEEMHALARDYVKIGQREKALEHMRWILQTKGADAILLNEMGVLCGELGDWERQEKYYRESARVSHYGAPLFNLALTKYQRGLYTEALINIDEALAREKDAHYFVLKALILKELGHKEESESCLYEGMKLFGSVEMMEDWELSWYLIAVRQAGDGEKVKVAEAEQRKRKMLDVQPAEGMLPEIRQGG